MKKELQRLSRDQFVTLILDNEVTVAEFVTTPPLSWTRLVQRNGVFELPQGYPTLLTSDQARFEMKNWDAVSLPAIISGLSELDESADYVLFGNNAGQGLPLARALPGNLIGSRAAVIYAKTLPEKSAYETIGYRTFFRRSEAVSRVIELAKNTSRHPALCFINTIQHNELNYHEP